MIGSVISVLSLSDDIIIVPHSLRSLVTIIISFLEWSNWYHLTTHVITYTYALDGTPLSGYLAQPEYSRIPFSLEDCTVRFFVYDSVRSVETVSTSNNIKFFSLYFECRSSLFVHIWKHSKKARASPRRKLRKLLWKQTGKFLSWVVYIWCTMSLNLLFFTSNFPFLKRKAAKLRRYKKVGK